MRIVGDIPHPTLKITIFLHDSKYAVKFEAGLYEQTYKFRSGDEISSVEDIQTIVDDTFINQVQAALPLMHQHKLEALGRRREESEDEFDVII